MIKIDPKRVRQEGVLAYLKNHYKVLSKKQIYDIAVGYINATYMRNGSVHVDATNEMLKKCEGE